MKSAKNEIENIYIIDFETRNAREDVINDKTSVWLYDICKIDTLQHIQGLTIEEFMKAIKNLAPATFYSHNLKFDGSFILYYLLKNNFTYTLDFSNIKPKEFCTLINDENEIFNIKICFENKKGTRIKQQVELRDSSKKIRGSVKQIALSYHLPIKKLEIDYTKERPVGYNPTLEELEYIKHDTEIIAYVVKNMYEKGMIKLTASSDAFSKYKEENKKWYSYLFPVIPFEYDQYIRNALKGGLCYINPKHKGRILNEVSIYDSNSFYPFIACKYPLPYGKPLYFEGEPKVLKDMPLWIAHIEICCKLEENKIPCIQLRKFYMYGRNEFLIDTFGELCEIWITNIDLDLIKESYEIYQINWIDGFYFCSSRKLFKSYLEPLYQIKEQSQGVERETNKVLLNGLLGKFATKTVFKNKMPCLLANDFLTFEVINEEIRKPIYTAITVFVNSWGRYLLGHKINLNFNNFVYCDTDSLHLLGNESNTDYLDIEIDETKLGAFKNEYKNNPVINAKYLNEKTYYLILKDKNSVIKCSGAPDDLKKVMTFDNFKYNAVFDNRLVPKYVKGGCVLVNTKFSIKSK